MENKIRIFISYRRVESQDFAGRLYDNLSKSFSVFLDKEGGIGYGQEFPLVLEEEVKKADIVLMIIGSDYLDELKKREDEVDFVRTEITLAYASQKIILPILMHGATFPQTFPKPLAFVQDLNYYPFGEGEFSMYVANLKKHILNEYPKLKKKESFSKKVSEILKRERVLLLYSQDFNPIQEEVESLEKQLRLEYGRSFYAISIPPFEEDESAFFSSISSDCGFQEPVTKAVDFFRLMRKRLQETHKPILFFITDMEDGDRELNRKLATLLRNLYNAFRSFNALLIGKKELARVLHEEGGKSLSPLNIAKEMFFPYNTERLDESLIVQELQRFIKERERLCPYLERESLNRFTIWSYDELINALFWKNLLTVQNGKYLWREEVKEIAKEILECNE